MSELVERQESGGVPVTALRGHIDSGNAPEVEREIFKLRAAHPGEAAILDAEELEYISSAGLMVIIVLMMVV